MTLLFSFSTGWLLQLFVIYSTYFLFFFIRKSRKGKTNFKEQFYFALGFLLLCYVGEFLGVSMKLWTYFPSNWPVEVWIGYFGIGLFSYQLVHLVDEVMQAT